MGRSGSPGLRWTNRCGDPSSFFALLRGRAVLVAVVLLAGLGLIAAACGGDDSEASPAEMVIGTWEFTTAAFVREM